LKEKTCLSNLNKKRKKRGSVLFLDQLADEFSELLIRYKIETNEKVKKQLCGHLLDIMEEFEIDFTLHRTLLDEVQLKYHYFI
jgi:hypothetical protein